MRRTQILLRNIRKDYKSGYEMSKRRMRLMMKWRRNKKRRRKAKLAKKKAKNRNRLPSCVPFGTVFLTTGARRRIAIKKKTAEIRKRRALKLRKQRRRRIKHFHGHRWKRSYLLRNVHKMTVAQVRNLLSRKKLKRIRKRRRLKLKLKRMDKPKRRALKLITRAIRIAKHRKKKQLRYKRYVIRRTEKPKHTTALRPRSAPETVTWKRIHPEVDVTVEYTNDYPEKVAIIIPDELYTYDKVHLVSNKEHRLDCGVSIQLSKEVKGIAGRVAAKLLYKDSSPQVDFRFRFHDFVTPANDEASIMAQLLKGGSKNCLRTLFAGCSSDIRYLITTKYGKTLEELIVEHKQFEVPVAVHIVQQTFTCVRELHKLGYCYTNIRPSVFASVNSAPQRLVLTEYQFLRSFKDIHADFINTRTMDEERVEASRSLEPVQRLRVHPYMSRSQHLRSFRGPVEDYESWFYVCARVVNGEPLKWETQTDPFEMLLSKIDFPSQYGHRKKMVNNYMALLHQYALSATLTNCNTVASFISRILEQWKKALKCENLALPWIDARELEVLTMKRTMRLTEQVKKLQEADVELKKEYEEWKKWFGEQLALGKQKHEEKRRLEKEQKAKK